MAGTHCKNMDTDPERMRNRNNPTGTRIATTLAMAAFCALPCAAAGEEPTAVSWIEKTANPLEDTAEMITALVARADGRRLVLLGESTHGTHEYYHYRDQISRALIESGGVRFIAVEGDWAALRPLNEYVAGRTEGDATASALLSRLSRWPAWMWGNEETATLLEWLRQWNRQRPEGERVSFVGMDVYSPWQAADMLAEWAKRHFNEGEAEEIRSDLAHFLRHRDNERAYIQANHPNQAAALAAYSRIESRLAAKAEEGDVPDWDMFAMEQSLRVVRGAHHHFIGMAIPGARSWNSRVEHMKGTVSALFGFFGDGARGIVWAHNTHIGDARATAMADAGQINIGHLARERWGAENVFALGFATHRGTVKAGREWGGARIAMDIPEAATGSIEYILNRRFPGGAWLCFADPPAAARQDVVHHRAIGVVYRPENEAGNYVPTRLGERYDALIFFPETRALSPIDP